MTTVGLVGLGTVGTAFAERLLERDVDLVVYDREESKRERATEMGARAVDAPAATAQAADHVLLSLPSNDAVVSVMEDDDGLLGALDAGQVVLDAGTTRPALARRYAKRCEAVGAGFLDAPLTVISDTRVMVGGDAEDYQRVTDVLDAVAVEHRRVGEAGAGQVLKLGRQILEAGREAAQAEAVEFCRGSGVDPELLVDFLEMDVHGRLFGDDFTLSGWEGVGALGLRRKDLANAADHAADLDLATPVTSVALEAHKAGVRRSGDEPWSHAGMVIYWRALHGEG